MFDINFISSLSFFKSLYISTFLCLKKKNTLTHLLCTIIKNFLNTIKSTKTSKIFIDIMLRKIQKERLLLIRKINYLLKEKDYYL